MNYGRQLGRILGNWVDMNDRTKNLFVNFKFKLSSGDAVWSKVYITEKSYGIAREALKKCGFDIDRQELGEIEENSELLAGKEVLLDVYEDEYNGKPQTRVDIVIERQKVDRSALAKATAGLRAAKHANRKAAPEEGVPPGVAHIPKAERERLDKEAEGEGIPF